MCEFQVTTSSLQNLPYKTLEMYYHHQRQIQLHSQLATLKFLAVSLTFDFEDDTQVQSQSAGNILHAEQLKADQEWKVNVSALAFIRTQLQLASYEVANTTKMGEVELKNSSATCLTNSLYYIKGHQ